MHCLIAPPLPWLDAVLRIGSANLYSFLFPPQMSHWMSVVRKQTEIDTGAQFNSLSSFAPVQDSNPLDNTTHIQGESSSLSQSFLNYSQVIPWRFYSSQVVINHHNHHSCLQSTLLLIPSFLTGFPFFYPFVYRTGSIIYGQCHYLGCSQTQESPHVRFSQNVVDDGFGYYSTAKKRLHGLGNS